MKNKTYFFLNLYFFKNWLVLTLVAFSVFMGIISLISLNSNPVLAQSTNPNAPLINSYVIDTANVLDLETKELLESSLRQLEKDTNGVQFIIYTEENIPDGTTLEERTLKIAETNKIGKSGADNGVLFYLATQDRKYRWEVGYGVESTLNSPLLGRVSRDYMVTNFKNGDFQQGILNGVNVVTKILMNSTDADILKLQNEDEKITSSTTLISLFIFNLILPLLPWIIFLIIIISINKFTKNSKMKKNAKNDKYYYSTIPLLFGGRGGGGNFGGGLGGGGFGGFSGGGGGFGGGGSSGGF